MENESHNNQLADIASTNANTSNIQNQPHQEQKKRISIEMIFASLSLLISLFTFVITALQTQIMQNQQKAAVWAYLEATIGISGNGFYCEVQNKGVGAAIIEEVNYYYENKKYKDFEILAKEIIKDSTFNYDYYSTNPIDKKVFAAGEKILVFGVKDMKFAEKLVRPHIIIEVRYANIYGETFFYKSK
jgi:hypothetical protein